jgi:hypothetical protein
MKKLLREIPLSNGLVVRFYDATRRYFGDYHQVRIEICCEIPITADLFEDANEMQKALKVLGPNACYRRHEEHHGVASSDVEKVAAQIIERFLENSLSYFNGSGFSRRLVQSELERAKKKPPTFVAYRPHV